MVVQQPSKRVFRFYFDDTVPGFGIRVGKRSKTYVIVRGRTRERVSIGTFDAIKLSDARTEAKRLWSAAPETIRALPISRSPQSV